MTDTAACPACLPPTGFKKYAFAFLLGALMTLTLPPIGIFPVMALVVPGLAMLSRLAPSGGKSFLTGWAFGAGYFIFGLYWVSAALFVDIDMWKWVLPFSAIIGPAALALTYGFIPLLAHPFRKNMGAHAMALVTTWSAVEWARGHWFTGFPWNLPGYTWHWALPVMQASAFVGIYGLTLLTVFWAMIPLLLNSNRRLAHIAIASLALVTLGGAVRLSMHPTVQSGHYSVRIVQANIPEETKWNKDDDWRNFEKHMNLSALNADAAAPPTFVIWPETAVNADLAQFPEIAHLIAIKMPKGATAILGALRVDQSNPNAPKFYNSVSVLDEHAKVIANYDKHHLVPFGEYIPYREHLQLTPMAAEVSGVGDFTRGPGVQTLHIADLPAFSPLVCYEAIFPGEVADEAHRPDWLVNVTNDGWYLKTAGPHQHFAAARMRAIEEGLPLARAANTGISAMIDPVGRILAAQPLMTQGYVDAILPAPLPPTVYARFGDLLFLLMLLVSGASAFALQRGKP